jgi:hypothetical protein
MYGPLAASGGECLVMTVNTLPETSEASVDGSRKAADLRNVFVLEAERDRTE